MDHLIRRQPRGRLQKVIEYTILGLALALAAVLMIVVFEHLPIQDEIDSGSTTKNETASGTVLAIDWRSLWHGLKGGKPTYGADSGLYNPPWSMIPMLPLGYLSLRASWGMLTLITLIVLVLSVPHTANRKQWAIQVFLLVSSFPAMRHIADGNFEGLVIAGILLILHSYAWETPWLMAGGILLATTKPQEVWLLMPFVVLSLGYTWPVRQQVIAAGVTLLVMIGSLALWGQNWLMAALAIREQGSIMDVSLSAALSRLGLSPIWQRVWWGFILLMTLYVMSKGNLVLSRHKAAFLIAMSLLLAPYAAGNSFLTIVAIGIIPLLSSHLGLALVLLLLTNLPYFAPLNFRYAWEAYYWTSLLLISASVFAWQILYRGSEKSKTRSNQASLP